MSPRTFYRTEIRVVVLSETPFQPDSLADVAHAIEEGDCSGEWDVAKADTLNAKQAAEELTKQGSDPAFFSLTDDGEEADA